LSQRSARTACVRSDGSRYNSAPFHVNSPTADVSIKSLYALARPLLFSMDAERAHHLTLSLLRSASGIGLTRLIAMPAPDPRVVMGLRFSNTVGLAAGLDKDGSTIDGLAALGFGFLEIGTVTPRAQVGNPLPRMFRLPEASAIINRMGFNNGGVDAFVANVQRSRFFQERQGVLGLNIGKNADTPMDRAAEDYLFCLEKVYPYASYVTVNISSPNTKNLRQLQGGSELDNLLAQLKVAGQRLSDRHKRQVPLVLKIAPDMEQGQVQEVAQALLRHGMDGVIATNTTIDREKVKGLTHADEAGGLSGRPVFEASNRVIRALKAELGDAVPIIGVGGIVSGDDASEKIAAGASLVQIYTGLIYRGPSLVRECIEALRSPA
jgi:dihydroorotate dehydrogenase